MSPFPLGFRHTSDGPPGADVTEDEMTARMKNPAMVLPDVVKGVNTIYKAIHSGGAAPEILELVHLRASQINGCAACIDMGGRAATKAGETPSGCGASWPGGRRRTSPTPSARRWRSPRPPPAWPTAPSR